MRQKVENEIWRLNAYLYDVASTMEFYYICVLPGTCTCKARESQKCLCDLCMTANTSVHPTLKEFKWTAAKSYTFWEDNHDILKYIFNYYGQI